MPEQDLNSLKQTEWFASLPDTIKPLVEKYPPMYLYVDQASGIAGHIASYEVDIDKETGSPVSPGVLLAVFMPYERLAQVAEPVVTNIIDTSGKPMILPDDHDQQTEPEEVPSTISNPHDEPVRTD